MRKLFSGLLLAFLFFLVFLFGFNGRAGAVLISGCWSCAPDDVNPFVCAVAPCPAPWPPIFCAVGDEKLCCPNIGACDEELKEEKVAEEGPKPIYCDPPSNTKIYSAIGCLPTSAAGFASFFLKWFLGIAGVVAFFLIIAAGFQIVTSAGNPEKLEGAKQLLTAAIVGL